MDVACVRQEKAEFIAHLLHWDADATKAGRSTHPLRYWKDREPFLFNRGSAREGLDPKPLGKPHFEDEKGWKSHSAVGKLFDLLESFRENELPKLFGMSHRSVAFGTFRCFLIAEPYVDKCAVEPQAQLLRLFHSALSCRPLGTPVRKWRSASCGSVHGPFPSSIDRRVCEWSCFPPSLSLLSLY